MALRSRERRGESTRVHREADMSGGEMRRSGSRRDRGPLRAPRAGRRPVEESRGGRRAGGSARKIASVGAVAAVILLGLSGAIWLSSGSGSDDYSAAARTQLAALLATPPRSILPDAEDLLSQVAGVRGRLEKPLLRDLVENGPPRVRLNAARLLVAMKDDAALALLENLARDPDELTRLVASDCAGRLGGRRPLGELRRALTSERVDVRSYAIESLEDSGNSETVDLLAPLLEHPDPETRAIAARAILALKPSALEDLGGGGGQAASSAVALLAEAVRSTQPVARAPEASSRAAGGVEDKDDVEGDDADDGDEELLAPAIAWREGTRQETARRETPREPPDRTPRPEAAPVDKPAPKPKAGASKPKVAASNQRPRVPSAVKAARQKVPSLLEAGRYGEALELLGKALDASIDEDAGLYRLRGLTHLGQGSLDEALADLQKTIDLAPALAPAYFDLSVCYGAKGSKRNAYAALVMALRFGFRDVLALRGEERLDLLKETPAFRSLMDHYFHSPLAAETDDARRLRFATKRLQGVFQRQKDPYVRALAIVRFPEAGGLEATEVLCRFLKDRAFIVRRALAEILGTTRDPGSVSFLCRQLQEPRASAHRRQALVWALHRLEGEEPAEAILSVLDEEDLAVQIAAAAAVGDRPDRRAVEPLIELLETAEPLDRLTVAEALGKISGKDLGPVVADWQNWWKTNEKSAVIGEVHNPCSRNSSHTVVMPPAFSERTGKEKLRALRRFGGSRQTEAVVALALEWLARHQNSDGRWDTDEWALRCDERKAWERVTRVRRRNWDVQVSGLALMAFLGAGHTHVRGEYHKTVRRGLEFLKKRQRADGYFVGDHHYRRSHEIATVAVTEAYLMTRDCELKPHAERAIRFILGRQYENGGWGWHVRESHTSLTGWNLLALMTASEAGIPVTARSLVSLRHFLDRVTVGENEGPQRPGFAFDFLRPAAQVGESLSVEEHEDVRSGGSLLSTTVGLWCRTFLGQSSKDPRVSGALAQLRGAPPRLDRNGRLAIDERLFFGAQAAL
ncbi:MAG: HEAT repeat domain-containing protein, partial [Planctomycetota bacterium]|nr:HEAT repeat domain-containing protein [Planctomycetota bacterium]